MKLDFKNIHNSIDRAYLFQCPYIEDINQFKKNYLEFLKSIKPTDNEETLKDYLNIFLRDTYYKGKFLIKENVNNIDLVVYNGKQENDKIGIIVETKAIKSNEMITTNDLNKKSFYEIIQYYLEERIIKNNLEIKHLIITNTIDWFIFNSTEFERLFCYNKPFIKKYKDWYNEKLVSKNKEWFYTEIAKPFVENELEDINCTYFQLSENLIYSDTSLIELYKVFSPENLLKLPFQNDSNTLNTDFYNELLHIIGLYETKDNTKKIERLKKQDRNEGSLLENIISIIETDDIIQNLEQPERFGDTPEEQIFSIGLELSITWINRIIFLKLLESQLVKYNNDNKDFKFLNSKKIKNFETLKELFFEVIAVKNEERKKTIKDKYEKIPYLNSSLFELTELEKETVKINHLKQETTLTIFKSTVLKDELGKRKIGKIKLIDYIFDFLDSFNFASDNKLEIQENNKTIINSSVLGLIFEKINGYKEGSFFTPGYITMYICRDTIRKAVIQKFNSVYGWNCINIKPQLYNKISEIDLEKANETFNSIRICDPAVGSGHFLVSALNELIAIKSELGILIDSEGNLLRKIECKVENDELLILDNSEIFVYNFKNKISRTVQETIFKEKRKLIENCLFGVDINPKSVHICRLRLWIELLKNAYYTDESNFTDLETLPNIDINIKHGNSLISRFSLNGNTSTSLSNNKLIKATLRYKKLVSDYKNTSDKNTKQFFQKQINELKAYYAEIANPIDKDYIELHKKNEEINSTKLVFTKEEKVEWDKKIVQLTKELSILRKKYDEKLKTVYGNTFEWRFEFPEVLNDNGFFVGFDAIIGNPPYIEFKDLEKKYKEYFENKYLTAKGKYDIYILFYELSFSILKTNGILGFITPTRFAVRDYGKDLRNLILKNYSLQQYIDFSDIQLFSEAINYTGIFILSKIKHDEYLFDYLKQTQNNSILNPLFEKLNSSLLKQEKWNFKGNEIDTIISKVKLNSSELKKLVNGINQGVATGKDEVFIVSNKNENFNNFEMKFLKPFLKGKDISKYKINWSNHYLIYPYDKNGKVIKETEFKQKAPIIYNYLLQNKNLLKGRSYFDKSNKLWYELWNQRKPATFEKIKIVTLDNASHNSFTLDKDNFYGTTTVYSITLMTDQISYLYLLGILNSNLLDYFHKQNSIPQANGFYRYQASLIENMPIKIADKKTQKKIEQLVLKILSRKELKLETIEQEKEIDKLVYKIYGMDENEIEIIEKHKLNK